MKKDKATLQSNRYDYNNRRLVKTTASGTVYFLYGQTGLLAEYQSNGDFIQGYGYYPDASYTTSPVYTLILKASGTGYDVDFYHNDHLATPQKLTNSTGAVSWAMESNAFGEVTIKTQTTTNNLRFPGQYADSEIGLNQNYFRDYAPNLGRYVETDPIGLGGGINTFVYANNSPILITDYKGLHWPKVEREYSPSCDSKCKDWMDKEFEDMSWINELPNCPCNKDDVPSDWGEDIFIVEAIFHNNRQCYRSPSSPGGHGQQCCYEVFGKKLITEGPGAGTPDKWHSGEDNSGHRYGEVFWEFFECGWYYYNQVRPPNNGNNCPKNRG